MLKVDRNQSVVQPFLAQNQAQTGNYEALNDIFKGENTYIYIGNIIRMRLSIHKSELFMVHISGLLLRYCGLYILLKDLTSQVQNLSSQLQDYFLQVQDL